MAKALPIPAAAPLTALIQGLEAPVISSMMGLYSPLSWSSTRKCSCWVTVSARSAPAQKARPAPVRITTRTASSSLTSRTASSSSRRNAASNALRLSGRLRVTTAMLPRRSTATVWYLLMSTPCGIKLFRRWHRPASVLRFHVHQNPSPPVPRRYPGRCRAPRGAPAKACD